MTYTFYCQHTKGKRFAKTVNLKNLFSLQFAIGRLEIEGFKVEVIANNSPFYETGKGFINQ